MNAAVLLLSLSMGWNFIEPAGAYVWPKALLPAQVTVFDRDYLEDFNPTKVSAVPVDGLGSSIFLTAGEHEPVSFIVVCPTTQTLDVAVSGLTNGVSTIDENWITVRKVVRTLVRNLSNDNKHLTVAGRFLPSWTTQAVAAGEFRQVWLDVYAPLGTQPGKYVGSVEISGHKDWPLAVEVLPITLVEDPGKSHGLSYNLVGRLHDIKTGLVTRDFVLKELHDIWDHGGRSLNPALQVDYFKTKTTVYPDYANMVVGLQLLIDSGHPWKHVMVLPNLDTLAIMLGHNDVVNGPADTAGTGASLDGDLAFQSLAADAVQGLQKVVDRFRKTKGLKADVWLKCEDELFSNKFNADLSPLYMRYAKICRDNSSLKLGTTISTHNPQMDASRKQIDGLLDLRIHQGFSFEWWLCRTGNTVQGYQAELNASGDKAWFYHNERGVYHDAEWQRIINGVFFEGVPFSVHMPWIYQYFVGSPFDDSREGNFGCYGFAFPSDETYTDLVPTRSWEAFREGFDDVRYLKTLAVALNTSPTALPKDLVLEVGGFLARVRNFAPSTIVANYTPKAGTTLESPIVGGLAAKYTGADWQAIRRRAADLIIQIQQKGQ